MDPMMRDPKGAGNAGRPARRRLSCKIPVLIFLLVTVPAAFALPARIIMIRHAEKPEDDRDVYLSAEGRVRAQRLTAWLSEEGIVGANRAPSAFFAAAPSAHGTGVRCLQTLEPAAQHFDLPVRTPHRPGEYAKLARHLLRSPELHDKIVVVCWSHQELPKLAAALGVRPAPPKWKDKDFSSAYIITFQGGNASLEHAKQRPKKK